MMDLLVYKNKPTKPKLQHLPTLIMFSVRLIQINNRKINIFEISHSI